MFLNDPILYRCKSLDYIVYKEKDFSGNNLQIALKKIFANEKVGGGRQRRRKKVINDSFRFVILLLLLFLRFEFVNIKK